MQRLSFHLSNRIGDHTAENSSTQHTWIDFLPYLDSSTLIFNKCCYTAFHFTALPLLFPPHLVIAQLSIPSHKPHLDRRTHTLCLPCPRRPVIKNRSPVGPCEYVYGGPKGWGLSQGSVVEPLLGGTGNSSLSRRLATWHVSELRQNLDGVTFS